MLKLISILLVSVAFMQVSATETNLVPASQNESTEQQLGEPRVLIIAKMTKEVLKLKLSTAKAALDISSNVNEYKKQIKAIVKVSEENIRDQLNDLDEIIKNATAKAKRSRKSIWKCVRAEKLSRWRKVRSGKITKCKKTMSFETLKLKIAKLAAIKVQAVSMIPNCLVLHPLSNKNLKNCIQKKLDDAYTNINRIKSEIDEDASQIYEKSNQCIEDNLGDLDMEIEQITYDFKKCVRNKRRDD